MARLFGSIAALSVAGVEIAKDKDGGFEVPDEQVAELKQAFSLRDTPEEPEKGAPDVPAEIHEAAIAEAEVSIANLTEAAAEARRERDRLAAQVEDLKAQLEAAKKKK